MKDVSAYINDDYCDVSFDRGSFYYGYETTICLTCGSINCPNEDHEDDGKEWCFVGELDGKEMIIPASELTKDEFLVWKTCLLVLVSF